MTSDEYQQMIDAAGITPQLEAALQGLTSENVAETSAYCLSLLKDLSLPHALRSALSQHIDPLTCYAVRSSCLAEDLREASFAGQYTTTLEVRGLVAVEAAILDCYRSLYAPTVLAYLAHSAIPASGLSMAVLVQEMVDAQVSGVAFTVNPLTGDDREMVIELVAGLGEGLVSGRLLPESYRYNWFEQQFVEPSEPGKSLLVDENTLKQACQTFLGIQKHFGFPCDIEFAILNGELYILQARAVTRVMYGGIRDQWTTADFKDGGVSSGVCKPYMWSLYDFIWEQCFGAYLEHTLCLKNGADGILGKMFFGRPFWNLSRTKAAMAQMPGYRERDFDNDLGIKPTYAGEGQTTRLSLRSLFTALRILRTHKRNAAERLRHNPRYRDELLALYRERLEELEGLEARGNRVCQGDIPLDTRSQWESAWIQLVYTDYQRSETCYFNQIFTNTVGFSLFRDSLVKWLAPEDFFALVGALDDVSHLRPVNSLWAISRSLRSRSVTGETSPVTLLERHDVQQHLALFGYHSDKELDVSYPHYAEDPAPVLAALGEFAALDDNHDPLLEQHRQRQPFSLALEALKASAGSRRFARLERSVDEMRLLLWWREEFRDISTRFYYLIRLCSLGLARTWVAEGILEDSDDLWFLAIEDVRRFIAGELAPDELRYLIAQNRDYYESFRNYRGDNEIGSSFDLRGTGTFAESSQGETEDRARTGAEGNAEGVRLCGIGAGGSSATGTARVIADLSQIARLEPDDILVTRFTDTGWTTRFAFLKGVVTEYGGTLCHAAIVSREYGIPCVVCLQNAIQCIPDGAQIRINGATGSVEVLTEGCSEGTP